MAGDKRKGNLRKPFLVIRSSREGRDILSVLGLDERGEVRRVGSRTDGGGGGGDLTHDHCSGNSAH